MADSFQLEIVTPEKLVVKDHAEEMQIPGKNGYLGILPGHAPLITELAVGAISYRSGSETHYLCVAWGFAEVLPDKVTILAETAERGEDVDCARAQKARERAEKRLTSGEDQEVDVPRAQDALARATTRLEVAQKEGQTSASH
jgi:F-type H+-transporting ATPase subunit epsilon